MKVDIYKPTLRSFIGSIAYSSSLLVVPAVGTYLFYHKSPALIVIADVIMGLLFLSSALSTVLVHRNVVVISEEGIGKQNGLRRQYLEWQSIGKALFRERHNKVSRTDRLVMLESDDGVPLVFPSSVYSNTDEIKILEEIRRRIPTSIQSDTPTL